MKLKIIGYSETQKCILLSKYSAHSNSTSKDLVKISSWTCHYKKTKYNSTSSVFFIENN